MSDKKKHGPLIQIYLTLLCTSITYAERFYFADQPSIQPFETLRAVEGTTLVIPCNVIAGNPAETFTQWMRDGVGFNQSGTSLVLSTIERSQSGTYVCMAQNTYFDNSHGEDNKSVTVDVECKYTLTSKINIHF